MLKEYSLVIGGVKKILFYFEDRLKEIKTKSRMLKRNILKNTIVIKSIINQTKSSFLRFMLFDCWFNSRTTYKTQKRNT